MKRSPRSFVFSSSSAKDASSYQLDLGVVGLLSLSAERGEKPQRDGFGHAHGSMVHSTQFTVQLNMSVAVWLTPNWPRTMPPALVSVAMVEVVSGVAPL